MKALTALLFIVGLALEGFAFLGYYEDDIPWALRLLDPTFAHASKGYQTLMTEDTLKPSQEGFDELSKEVINQLAPLNTSNEVEFSEMYVTGFRHILGSTQIVTPRGMFDTSAIMVEMSNGQSGQWDVQFMGKLIEENHRKSILHYSVAVFMLGAILQVLGFWIDRRNTPIDSSP